MDDDMMASSASTCAALKEEYILACIYELAGPFICLLISTGFMDKYAMPSRKSYLRILRSTYYLLALARPP